MTTMSDLWSALSAIEASDDLVPIQQAVRDLTRPLGYDRIVLFSITAQRDELVERVYWVEGDWFETGEAVDALTYIRRCPVTRHVLDTDRPFFWTKTHTEQGASYHIVSVPQGSGIHGLQVPVFGHAGLEGAISFGGARIDATAQTRQALTLLAMVVFQAARRLLKTTRRPACRNSRRESGKSCGGWGPGVAWPTLRVRLVSRSERLRTICGAFDNGCG